MGSILCCVHGEEVKGYIPPENRIIEAIVINIDQKMCEPTKYSEDALPFINSYEEINLK